MAIWPACAIGQTRCARYPSTNGLANSTGLRLQIWSANMTTIVRLFWFIALSMHTSHASVPKYQDNQTESQLGIPFLVIHSCFINVFSSMPGDCHDSLGRKDVCVVGAINKFTQQLSDYTKTHNTKNRMNISHFAVCFNAASFWFLHKVSSCPQLTPQI